MKYVLRNVEENEFERGDYILLKGLNGKNDIDNIRRIIQVREKFHTFNLDKGKTVSTGYDSIEELIKYYREHADEIIKLEAVNEVVFQRIK